MNNKKPSSLVKVCPKCDRFYGLKAEADPYFPVHKTDDLTKCPECQTPLEDPKAHHYLFVNKRAAAEAKAKKNMLLENLVRETTRLKAENAGLRKTILQLQDTFKQQNTDKHQPRNLSRCIECGKEFEPQTQTHQYCSKGCQIKTNNRKRAERREQKKRDEGTHHASSDLKIFPTE